MKALILVDIQNDFLPGGALAVPDGDAVIQVANKLQPHFDLVIATQDWHPEDHGSFAANHDGAAPGEVVDLDGLQQILWPVHCVQGTPGSDLAAKLHTQRVEKIFFKGTDAKVDSYSAFSDNAQRRSTGLGEYLNAVGVDEVYIMGLATDYCVLFSVLDACHGGFSTHVVVDGCRGVDLQVGDSDRAFQQMSKEGAQLLTSDDILQGRWPSGLAADEASSVSTVSL